MYLGTYYGNNGLPYGGRPDTTVKTSHTLTLPDDPHGDTNGDGFTNLESWVKLMED